MDRTRGGGRFTAILGAVWTLACSSSPGPGTTTDVLTVSRAGTGSGTVSGNGIDCGNTCTSTLPAGTAVSLSAVAAGGSTFAGWSGCDSTSGATCTLTLGASRSVSATFNLATQNFGLTVTKTGAGTGTVSGNGIDCGTTCAVQLAAGTAVSLTAAPAAGSGFTS